MRILHIAEAYSPAAGGVSKLMQGLSEELVRHGHDVTVATGVHPARKFDILNGVKVVSFNVNGKIDLGYRGEIKRYQEFVRTFPCDILMTYAAQTWATDLIFPLLDELSCVKVFVPCGYSSLYNPDYYDYYKQMPDILNKFDHIVYINESCWDAQFGQRHGIRHFSIWPEGTETSEFATKKPGFRKKYGIKTKYMLLNVATYGRNKAQHFILEAFYRARPADTTMVFIGAKPETKKTKMYYRLLQMLSFLVQMSVGMGTIRLLAGLERSWVVSAFQEADMFLLGSSFEVAIPLVIHEAMASGVPFISTRCGSIEELDGGFVVLTPYEMARGINILLENESLRRYFSEKGRNGAKHVYGVDKTFDEYEALYKRLLNSRKSR